MRKHLRKKEVEKEEYQYQLLPQLTVSGELTQNLQWAKSTLSRKQLRALNGTHGFKFMSERLVVEWCESFEITLKRQ